MNPPHTEGPMQRRQGHDHHGGGAVGIGGNKAPSPAPRPLDAFIIYSGDAARDQAFALAQELRTRGITVDIDPTGKGMKSQLKKMDREQARFAVIIGEEESATGNYAVKNSSTREQITVEKSAVADMIIKGL